MDLGIRNRIALVTGASSGVGRAVALSLAKEGARLLVAARRTSRLYELVEEAMRVGAASANSYYVDISDSESVKELLDRLIKDVGNIDILVANTGGPKTGAFLDMTMADWDDGYRSLLRGMLQLIDHAARQMKEAGWGRVVAITSMSVKEPVPNVVLSNTFRTALVSALKTLSIEVAKYGVTVNSIATGYFLTERLLELYGNEAAIAHELKNKIPAGRAGTVDEFAPLVAFLCSEQASYLTSQTIALDGGFIKSLY